MCLFFLTNLHLNEQTSYEAHSDMQQETDRELHALFTYMRLDI